MSGAFVDIGIITNIQQKSNKLDIGKNFGLFSTLANTSEAASGLIDGIVSTSGLTIAFLILSVLTLILPLIGVFKIKNSRLNCPH